MSPAAQDLRNRANRMDSSEHLKWQIIMQEYRRPVQSGVYIFYCG